MAIQRYEEQNHPSLLLDTLYCEEEKWDETENDAIVDLEQETSSMGVNPSFFPLLEQDLFWEDDELLSLFSKETEQHQQSCFDVGTDEYQAMARREALQWMIKVNARFGFTTHTAVLSINYLDRFLSSFEFQRDKHWMIQLVAVTCLSLAAKVEETQVPLLLDLQVEETNYVFDAKTVQRMELLVLSTLKWKMHPITPISFLDHIIRKLGLKTHLHWEFLRRCERLLLSVISDSRSVIYLPSVIATATMMNVIDQVELFNPIDYQNQLLSVIKISKEKVDECYELIQGNACKRKVAPSSGVIDGAFGRDSSNDSSAEPPLKKIRAREQVMNLPSLNRVFVDIVGSPS
ncbi:Cyclin-D3-1 [Hibiscus syriacus]|uniref:Cyclin-D3-1 n=1 Tax=Hibiscus syriacus TaxID=106335 RepID=A0A6A3BR40_HIBSY|nr:cyclin-D3-1-like [Hibiscus syriacus]KAE8719356.1 Cyclin-D3-1 [Hibiscus syriacus]